MIKRLLVYFALMAVALASCTRKDMEDVPVIIMPSPFFETGFEQAVSSIELTELSFGRKKICSETRITGLVILILRIMVI